MYRRLRGLAVAAVLAASAGVGVASLASADSGSGSTSQQRIVQIASPSTALLLIDTQTYLTDGTNVSGPLELLESCSAQFVTDDGYMVTAGHCADPTQGDLKSEFVTEYLQQEAINPLVGGCATGDTTCITNFVNANQAHVDSVATMTDGANITNAGVPSLYVLTQNVDLSSLTQQNFTTKALTAELKAGSDFYHLDLAVIKVDGSNFPSLPVGDSSAMQTGDPLAITGYPGSADNISTVASGLVPTSVFGNVTAIKQSITGEGTIFQTDAPIAPGSSGSAALNSQGQIVAIVSYDAGQPGSGQNTTVSALRVSSDLKDLLTQAGAVVNKPGQIDSLWRTGLTLFDGKHYKAAYTDFTQCAQLNPAQVGCASMATKALGLFGQDVPVSAVLTGTTPPTWLWAAVGAGVLVVIVLLAVVITRKRKTPQAAMASAWEQSLPPPQWDQPHPVAEQQWQPPEQQQPAPPQEIPACPTCGTLWSGYPVCQTCGYNWQ